MVTLSGGRAFAAALIAFVLGTANASAEQVCLPGTGLHCGRGRVDPGTQRYVATPGRPGTALEGAAALVGIVGMLIDIFDRPSSTVSTAKPEDPFLAQIRREKADLLAQAAEANRRGIEYVKKGEDRTAAGYFTRAMQWADQAGDESAALTYKRNLFNAIAQGKVKEAIRAERAGDLWLAASLLNEAEADASAARAVRVQSAIRDQRAQILARYHGAPPSKVKKLLEKKDCALINGQYLCD